MKYALETSEQQVVTLEDAIHGQHTMVVFVRHLG